MSQYAVQLTGQADESPTGVKALLCQADYLKQERSTTESHWADIAEITRPLRNEIRGPQTPGNKRMTRVFDATAINAAQKRSRPGTAVAPSIIRQSSSKDSSYRRDRPNNADRDGELTQSGLVTKRAPARPHRAAPPPPRLRRQRR